MINYLDFKQNLNTCYVAYLIKLIPKTQTIGNFNLTELETTRNVICILFIVFQTLMILCKLIYLIILVIYSQHNYYYITFSRNTKVHKIDFISAYLYKFHNAKKMTFVHKLLIVLLLLRLFHNEVIDL